MFGCKEGGLQLPASPIAFEKWRTKIFAKDSPADVIEWKNNLIFFSETWGLISHEYGGGALSSTAD